MALVSITLSKDSLELIAEALEEYIEDRENTSSEMLEEGTAIKKDNSYSDSDTGHNFVSDVDYTEEYETLTDKIESAKKISEHFQTLTTN